jgi:hypothetical protein
MPYRTGSQQPKPFSLPGGNFLFNKINKSNFVVAYSLRYLGNPNVKNAIRVRRSSDNEELNIGFIGQNLDTISLLNFAGANSVFITTFYDQNGNAINATQATAANQPRIVNSGVLEQDSNKKPQIYFDGINYFMNITNNFGANASITLNAVTTPDNNTNNKTLLGSDTNGYQFRIGRTAATRKYQVILKRGVTTIGVSNTDITTKAITTMQYNGTDFNFRLNGIADGNGTNTQTIGTTTNYNLGRAVSDEYFAGYMQELHVFSTFLNSDVCLSLEKNQGKYYNILI